MACRKASINIHRLRRLPPTRLPSGLAAVFQLYFILCDVCLGQYGLWAERLSEPARP